MKRSEIYLTSLILISKFKKAEKKEVKKEAPQKDPGETLKMLTEQCDTVQKRINVLEQRQTDLKKDALAKRKAKDERGALMALKKMKMFEKEVMKLEGQSIMLTQQKMMIESTHFDVDVINGMKQGKTTMESLNAQMNVDDIADLKDDLADLEAENAERQEFFAGIAQENNDDLLGELDELEALAMEEEMEAIPDAGISEPVNPNAIPSVPNTVISN